MIRAKLLTLAVGLLFGVGRARMKFRPVGVR
jgi:hypothetical protein